MTSLPPWIPIAEDLIGTKEKPGSENNPKIMAWAKSLGNPVSRDYTADSIPWCGLFVAYSLSQAGIDPITSPLWALSWKNFGESLSKPVFGCIYTRHRDGGGHVGFLVSQDNDYWHVLGGNQSDMVNVTRISKSAKCYFNFPEGFDNYKTALPTKKYDGKMPLSLKFD